MNFHIVILIKLKLDALDRLAIQRLEITKNDLRNRIAKEVFSYELVCVGYKVCQCSLTGFIFGLFL